MASRKKISAAVSRQSSTLLVGIDEVGYGPQLGPLLVVAVAAEVRGEERDLWKLLRSAVMQRGDPLDARLWVRDSKVIFNPQRGLRPLERNVLPFLHAVFPSARLSSYCKLVELIDPERGKTHRALYPWYSESDLALPLEVSSAEIAGRASVLEKAVAQAEVRFLPIRAALVEPGLFNDGVARYSNKLKYLFDLVSELVHTSLEDSKVPHAIFWIGKQSGRCYYLPELIRSFPNAGFLVIEEQKKLARYAMKVAKRNIELAFIESGEDQYFPIALASMIGKYIRELSMRLFNDYWCSRVPSIMPTNGYPPDAGRFLRDLKNALGEKPLMGYNFIRQR